MNNRNLEVLHLGDNSISNEGLREICDCLKEIQTIKNL